MNFALELLSPNLQTEITPLLEAHKEEIAHYPDIEFDPDWDVYYLIQDVGQLRIYTIRGNDGVLCGYGVFFVRYNPHYSKSLMAIQDVIYLNPELRGRSIGRLFIGWCDEKLRAEGVQVVSHHIKQKHNFGPMLERMGYELMDLIYVKRLDR